MPSWGWNNPQRLATPCPCNKAPLLLDQTEVQFILQGVAKRVEQSVDCYLGLGYHYRQINQKLIKERFKEKTAKGSQAKPIVIPGGQRLCMLKTASSEKWYQRLHTAGE